MTLAATNNVCSLLSDSDFAANGILLIDSCPNSEKSITMGSGLITAQETKKRL